MSQHPEHDRGAELAAIGQKVFNPLPGTKLGAKGYLGARTQPNSPTDNLDDIQWQVFDGWSYAVGDVVLGCNPVSSDVDPVAAIEQMLQDTLLTLSLERVMPHCVLAHIDVQAAAEKKAPGTTGLWLQSLAGNDAPTRSSTSRCRRWSITRPRAPDSTGSTSRPDREPTSPTVRIWAWTWSCSSRASTA